MEITPLLGARRGLGLFREVLADSRLDLLGGRLDPYPDDISRLDVASSDGVFEESSLGVGHQKVVVVLDVGRPLVHQPPEGGLVIVVDSTCPGVLDVIHGRAVRNRVERHRIDVVIPDEHVLDPRKSLEFVNGRVPLLHGSILVFEVGNHCALD